MAKKKKSKKSSKKSQAQSGFQLKEGLVAEIIAIMLIILAVLLLVAGFGFGGVFTNNGLSLDRIHLRYGELRLPILFDLHRLRDI
jgi:flagellar basal body-associated protein FliL